MTVSDPPVVTSAETLRNALSTIGRDETLRAAFVAACHAVERRPEYVYTSVRDELTGPIVDALFARVDVVRKQLSNGIVFDFYYRSKIARDFVMSVPEIPDHVWEPQTTRLALHLAEGAKHVVIGGAYFGDQAILVASLLRAWGGICHAFEPDTDQAAMLDHNAQLNALMNIRTNRLALWSDATSRLCLAGTDALASTVAVDPECDDAGNVTATTIDTYLAAAGIEHVELIMLDLEGGELEALKGARHQLSLPPHAAPALIFEVHRSYVDWSGGLPRTEICQYLTSFGYTIFAVRDFQSNYDLGECPIELVPIDDIYLDGPAHGFNMVAVRDAGAIAGARFRICPGVSPKLLLHRDPALHHPTGGLPPR